MLLPSKKTLESALSLDPVDAGKARKVLEAWRDAKPGSFRKWLCAIDPRFENVLNDPPCRGPGRDRAFLALRVLDVLLKAYGVEYIIEADASPYHRPDNSICYCNTGAAYAPTICFIMEGGHPRWQVTTYGDAIERMERRGVRFL